MQYKILGETLPVVLCSLEENERMITESGSMAWMSSNMRMDTSSNGGLGKAFGRMFSGEALFQNIYTAQGGPGEIAFASSFPGSIKVFRLDAEHEYIFQKRSFLASTDGVSLSVFFQKKFGAGLFGGEGFILQKVTGNGLAFAEFDGHVVEYELEAGQQIVVDSGYLAAMSTTCSMDIRTISGAKNIIFGGEGLFNTVITGPGHVWLQTMPALSVARSLQPYLVTSGG
ncbi:MAG: TIGR00266 family protein [Clostridia bacterium]|nr:TIGR00266 family protein [Clostridia bacterium]